MLVTDGANNGGQIHPLTAARLAAQEGVRIYAIGIGADPDANGTPGLLGLNPSLDLDEASLKEIASLTQGAYFRAHDGAELDAIGDTLDRLEPVAQQPTQARTAHELYAWPLALALLHLLQRLLRRPRFLQPHPQWRQRLERLRLRRRR